MKNILPEHRVYLLKFLLSSNIYLLAFFPMLTANGLTHGEILKGISIGTIAMIVGDFVSSLCVDRFGPKTPVFLGALLQAAAIISVPFCHSLNELIIVEILIGLSFPVILGADSKWLKHLSKGKKHNENFNQGMLFLSQATSAAIGCLLLSFPYVAFIVSAIIYIFAAILCLSLDDVSTAQSSPSLKNNLRESLSAMFALRPLRDSIAIGIMGVAPWFLQFLAHRSAQKDQFEMGMVQLGIALVSFAGVFFVSRFKLNWSLWGAALGGVVLVLVSAKMLWSAAVLLGLGLLFRGALAVSSREFLFENRAAHFPIATTNFAMGSLSKITQSLLLTFISSRL